MSDLHARARAWRDDDPDDATRAELDALLSAADLGSSDAVAQLEDRFSGMLEFGTAGLRGALGAGPNRMNRAVVIRAAAGLVAYLKETTPEPAVVIGFDARHNSDVFAADTAAVVTAAGGHAMVLPRPLPTPVLAYAIRHLGCDAGVMVTASHNPAQDNGYKVYLGDGSQIVPPADTGIAAHIAAVESVASVPRAGDGWVTLDDSVLDAYVAAAADVVAPGAPRDVTIVHTALHGVGAETVQRAFAKAGFAAPQEVSSQERPDPDFPTVVFPNPEEAGAIDLALEQAARSRPDLVVANDPDADRCAAAVEDAGTWRMLRGDELGALLGSLAIERVLASPDAERRVLASSIVSSRRLGAMARSAGLEHRETLTGFKWIARVPALAFGYEEALGYCVDPASVRDKDGISAALLLAELAARLKAQGRTLLDLLADLDRTVGVHATDAFSVRVADLSLIGKVMERLRTSPPPGLGGRRVVRTDDLSAGSEDLPPTEGLRYLLDDDTRAIVRPSGTEPKLKVYLEAIVPVDGPGDDDLTAARAEAAERLGAVRADLERLTAV